MSKLFISHSSQDDGFVRALRAALELHGQGGWIDSRELHGGDPLWTEIKKAIDDASAYAIVVSTDSLQSKWVAKELRHALLVQEQRGKERFPVIPLSLDGTKLGVLEEFYEEEPIYIPVTSAPGGIDTALHPILVALGERLPHDTVPTPQPKVDPLEELVLELTDLQIHQQDGVPRAAAKARLVYEPATAGQRTVSSAQSWRFIAPLGPIEADELRWYLEKYAIWPSEHFRARARKVEQNLVKWGQLLHQAAMPNDHVANVMNAWARIDAHAGRRFSVHVDASTVAGAPEGEIRASREAATLLLALPWELLHDVEGFLFQGAKPTRVRRRLPNTRALDVAVVSLPIRILLVSARPEDEFCGYINHRESALPLVEAVEHLGGLVRVRVRVLSPPTLPALRGELDRAREAREPYHVVHFDGHGVYDCRVGQGGLCFEHPQDTDKPERRRHQTVHTSELGPLLRDHRIPLVFLEACQTAQAEQASESVASALLKVGVASVVAMSHSVLVATARRFVEAFYDALARGKRIGDAMLAGQRKLKDDTFRKRIFGAGELRLEDWFVPVLFQEKDDPQLFRSTPSRQTQDDMKAALEKRLGDLPKEPTTEFIGRSRELLALERLLRKERYAVVSGQGGEGKTALAAEFGRWWVRSQQVHRAAFVSVETHSTVNAVLDAVGRQLVPNYSVATFDNWEKAIQPVTRALTEQSTLLVVDNMESILLPPYVETPDALSEDAQKELNAVLTLCARLNAIGDTRLVFTSREALPAPFDGERNRRELRQLTRADAVELVERVLNEGSDGAGDAGNSTTEQIEQLVEAVHCHARTLALLAPALRGRGVEATRASLVELMVEMERKFPGSREQSVFASVELSLRRLSEANRDRVRVLGVFHGGVDPQVLRVMMQWEEAEVNSLAAELIETGLATPNRYNHLTLDPALCPYLRGQMEGGERDTLTTRWFEAMNGYTEFLYQQQGQNTEMAATLTVLELPNLFALLDLAQRAGKRDVTTNLGTQLYSLLQALGKPRLLERVAQARETAAAAALGDTWNHAQFEAERIRAEEQLAGGNLHGALDGAQALLQSARTAGEQAYLYADYDLAMACWLLARVLRTAGGSKQSLPLLDEASQRFAAIVNAQADRDAERMASVCFADRGACLATLGRLDEAAAAYEENIRRAADLGDDLQVAVGKGELGSVRLQQRHYDKALAAYAEARARFTQLNDERRVAGYWYQTGMAWQELKQPEEAEDAYRKSLAIAVRLSHGALQATTLGQLGILYNDILQRPEEAEAFYRQAADKYIEIGDAAGEGRQRSNLAIILHTSRRLDQARQEIRLALECKEPFGHAVEPWRSWIILADIERDVGDAAAAAQARQKAIACYLAYRRDGGENHEKPGRLSLLLTQSLLEDNVAAAQSVLQQVAAEPELPTWLKSFLPALQAIVAGSRDRHLADAPELGYTMAAEILFLIETLEKAENQGLGPVKQ